MISQGISEQLNLLPEYLGNHLLLTLVALITGIVVCIPLGIIATRVKFLQWPILSLAGILQTIPGIALLALMVTLLGKIGFLPAVIALIIYSFLPILRNTVTGILGVEASVVEAAVGIGMTDSQLLLKVELPLALPVIVAGIRTAAVWVIGTATLATPVGATSLGNYIFSGLQTQNLSAIIIGCLSAATLAIVMDQLIHLAEIATAKRNKLYGIIASVGLLILLGGGISSMMISSLGNKDKETVIIGSKPFTEQYILADLLANHLQKSGYQTDLRSGMGSMILFEALSKNAVDCYVDYSGTIWTNVMKRKDLPDRKIVLKEMTDWLDKEHGILCLGALGFENTYALAVKETLAEKYNLQSIVDLSKVTDNMSMGSDYEFFSRSEWTALKEKYNLNFNKLVTLDPTLMYSAISQDEVDVISAYSTDGRIADLNLTVLKDPYQALPPYDAVLLLSPMASKRLLLKEQLLELINKIDDNLMRQANKLVDVDKLSVDSASAYIEGKINIERYNFFGDKMAQKIHNIDGNDSRASFSDKEKFALDVLVGLTKTPKAIPAIYHYDAEGSRLFDKITKLPEYYLTSCEIETLDRNKNRISENMNSEAFNLVEFGPGNGSKTKIIIDHLLNKKIDFQYIPIDISHSAIEMLMEDYKSCYPDLEINAVVADYFDGVKWLNRRSNRRNFVLFLGSNIGNFNFSDTRLFLRNLWITLNNKDIVLIGFDLKKDIELLLHAYNDLSGVTAEFSLNLLRRINNELGGNFNLEKFRHFATYEVASGAMESYLVSLVNQDVTVKEITRSFHFDSWEPIHVEYSYKYHISDIENLAVETGYKVVEHMYDKRKYFTDSLWQVIKE